MLTWNERDDAQKKAAGPIEAAPAAKAPFGAPFEQTDSCAEASPAWGRFFTHRHATVEPATADADAKAISTLGARVALTGFELRVVTQAGGAQFYEVRRGTQARTCSTLHGVRGFLAQISEATGRAAISFPSVEALLPVRPAASDLECNRGKYGA